MRNGQSQFFAAFKAITQFISCRDVAQESSLLALNNRLLTAADVNTRSFSLERRAKQ